MKKKIEMYKTDFEKGLRRFQVKKKDLRYSLSGYIIEKPCYFCEKYMNDQDVQHFCKDCIFSKTFNGGCVGFIKAWIPKSLIEKFSFERQRYRVQTADKERALKYIDRFVEYARKGIIIKHRKGNEKAPVGK